MHTIAILGIGPPRGKVCAYMHGNFFFLGRFRRFDKEYFFFFFFSVDALFIDDRGVASEIYVLTCVACVVGACDRMPAVSFSLITGSGSGSGRPTDTTR